MVSLNSTLINFSEKDLFFSIFENYGNDFEYRSNNVFRRTQLPLCPDCGSGMNHNDYNTCFRKNLGSVKIGRYICPLCGEPGEENREFGEKMKTEFFSVLDHVSYEGISALMEAIFPRGKGIILCASNDSMGKADFPGLENFNISPHFWTVFPVCPLQTNSTVKRILKPLKIFLKSIWTQII